jgi:hypothetical protein
MISKINKGICSLKKESYIKRIIVAFVGIAIGELISWSKN